MGFANRFFFQMLLYFRGIENNALTAALTTILTRLLGFRKVKANADGNGVVPGILHLSVKVGEAFQILTRDFSKNPIALEKQDSATVVFHPRLKDA